MIRIDDRTVELTDQEQTISEEFEALLDDGYGIHRAVDVLEERYFRQGIDYDFFEYLRT